MQDCSNSIANALELLQSCTKPSTWYCVQYGNCNINHTPKLTKDTPPITLTVELWGVPYKDFEENWPPYNGLVLHHLWRMISARSGHRSCITASSNTREIRSHIPVVVHRSTQECHLNCANITWICSSRNRDISSIHNKSRWLWDNRW